MQLGGQESNFNSLRTLIKCIIGPYPHRFPGIPTLPPFVVIGSTLFIY